MRSIGIYRTFSFKPIGTNQGEREVAVFEYTAMKREREEHVETGTVVAQSEQDALTKLAQFQYDNVRLRRMGGFKGFLKSFTADIK